MSLLYQGSDRFLFSLRLRELTLTATIWLLAILLTLVTWSYYLFPVIKPDPILLFLIVHLAVLLSVPPILLVLPAKAPLSQALISRFQSRPIFILLLLEF